MEEKISDYINYTVNPYKIPLKNIIDVLLKNKISNKINNPSHLYVYRKFIASILISAFLTLILTTKDHNK